MYVCMYECKGVNISVASRMYQDDVQVLFHTADEESIQVLHAHVRSRFAENF